MNYFWDNYRLTATPFEHRSFGVEILPKILSKTYNVDIKQILTDGVMYIRLISDKEMVRKESTNSRHIMLEKGKSASQRLIFQLRRETEEKKQFIDELIKNGIYSLPEFDQQCLI